MDQLTRRSAGKRSYTLTVRKRGRYIRARPMTGRPDDLAIDATVRAAASYQQQRRAESSGTAPGDGAGHKPAFVVKRHDFQRKVRIRRAANLVLFLVDASWSMVSAQRIEAAKGAVLSLLRDAYRRRDQVGLITFRGQEAQVVLPPTSSVELAQRVLKDVAVGGKTPLSAALLAADRICVLARRRNPEVMPLIILLTDGVANVSVTGMPPQEEAYHVAALLRQRSVRAVVIDMAHPFATAGLAEQLAVALGGPCYTLPQLEVKTLVQTIRALSALGGR